MVYHILKRIMDSCTGGAYYSVPMNTVYQTSEAVQEAARKYLAEYPGDVLYLVQEFAKVAVEPVITLTSTPVMPPGPVYRGAMNSASATDTDEEAVSRTPQIRPRLLVSVVTPSKEDYMRYLMVVAEGRIVKNAFGALELEDMPLTVEERMEVLHALGKS